MLPTIIARPSSRGALHDKRTEPETSRERLIDCLLDEIRTSLVLAGVTASTLNALLRQPEAKHVLIEFVPSSPIVFPTVRAGLLEGVDPRGLDHSDHFFRRLALAKPSLSILSGDAASDELAQAVGTWRSLCGVGERAARETIALIEAGSIEDLHLSDDIRRLLIAVQAGHSPCHLDGRAQIPAWFQRRHHPRMMANIAAELSIGELTAPVLILDVSVGGCGLDRIPPLPVGCFVRLKLDSGRLLEGRIRWRNGARAGVLFRKQLSFTDPLVSAG